MAKNRSIDYSKHEYLPHKKSKKSIPILIKICFSEGKLTKQFGPPHPPPHPTPPAPYFLREAP